MIVGFLGLGAIGAPMAVHLAGRGSLTVWNRTSARALAFARRHGARAAATPREAATQADVVITCLPTSREVEAVLDGEDGLLTGLRSGALLIDCTSGDPATSRRIAERLKMSGVAFADAPDRAGAHRRSWPQTFGLALLDQDVAIARTVLDECGVAGPLLDLAGRLVSAARAELGEAADYLDPIRLIERAAGVEIRG